MKQKIFLIFMGALAVLFGIYLSTQKSLLKTPQMVTVPTPRTAASKPPVVVIPEAPIETSFQVNAFSPAPTTLPVYSYTPIAISFAEASSFAGRIGFTEKPLKIKSGVTTSYQWKKDSTILTLDSENYTARLSFSQPEGSFFATSLVKDANQGAMLLKTLFSPQEGLCTIQLSQTTNGPFDGTTTTDVLTGHYYSCITPNQKPIVTADFSSTIATIIVNNSGLIRSISLNTLSAIYKTEERPILAAEEAVMNIKNGKGLLISLTKKGDLSFFDSPPQFNNISLFSYSFVYYQNAANSTLDPYYVFEGTTTSTERDPLLVKYAVSAMPSN